MEVESDSGGESQTSVGGVHPRDRRGIIEHYTTLMLQKLIWGPFTSVPELIDTLVRAGPFDSKQDIIEVYRGRRNLRRTIARMNAVRRATLQGMLGDLPVSSRPFEGEEVGWTAPGTDEFIDNWAPWSGGSDYSFMEGVMFDDQEEELVRYPHQGEDTEDFMQDTESESEEERATTPAS